MDLEQEEITIKTWTGDSDSKKIPVANPEKNPSRIRRQIVDHKTNLSDQKRSFHIQEIKNHFLPIFENNLIELCRLVENGEKTRVEKLIEEGCKADVFFSDQVQFALFFVDYDHLIFETESKKQKDIPEEESSPDIKEQISTEREEIKYLTIEPVISATAGGKIDNLDRETKLYVRLAGKSASHIPDEEKENGKSRPIPARFVQFKDNGNDPEGELEVKIQEGIHGRCELPRGTRVKKIDEPPDASDSYEQKLEVVTLVVVSLLLSTSVFVIVLFLF